MSKKTPGQIAFEAYNKNRGGVNHLGNKTPDWLELPQEIREAWDEAGDTLQDHAKDRVAAIIFDLVRDAVPVGEMARIVMDMEEHPPPYVYPNEHDQNLYQLAYHLAARVIDVEDRRDEDTHQLPLMKLVRSAVAEVLEVFPPAEQDETTPPHFPSLLELDRRLREEVSHG